MLRTFAVVLLLVASPVMAREAPPNLPDTPVARIFKSWLRVVNTRDSALAQEQALRYEAEDPNDSASVLEATRRLLQVGRQSGGFSVEQWQASSPEEMNLIVRNARGMRLGMRITVKRVGDDWRLAGLQLGAPGQFQSSSADTARAPAAPLSRAAPAGPRLPSRSTLTRRAAPESDPPALLFGRVGR